MVAAVATERDLAETFVQERASPGISRMWPRDPGERRGARFSAGWQLRRRCPGGRAVVPALYFGGWERHCEWDETDLGSHSRGPTLNFEKCEQNG